MEEPLSSDTPAVLEPKPSPEQTVPTLEASPKLAEAVVPEKLVEVPDSLHSSWRAQEPSAEEIPPEIKERLSNIFNRFEADLAEGRSLLERKKQPTSADVESQPVKEETKLDMPGLVNEPIKTQESATHVSEDKPIELKIEEPNLPGGSGSTPPIPTAI